MLDVAVHSETPPLLILETLQCIYSTLSAYFYAPPDENILKDNFFLINEVLDEMVNAGFPLTTETNPLFVCLSLFTM